MPSNVIKSYAKKAGKSTASVESAWEKAKKAASKTYDPKKEPEAYWGTVNKITKRKLKLDEAEENWLGIPDAKFIWHGEWSDPEIVYKDVSFSQDSVIDGLLDIYREANPEDKDDAGFDAWLGTPEGKREAQNELDDLLAAMYENAPSAEDVVARVKENGDVYAADGTSNGIFSSAEAKDDTTVIVKYDCEEGDNAYIEESDIENELNAVFAGTGWSVEDYDYRDDYGVDVVLKLNLKNMG